MTDPTASISRVWIAVGDALELLQWTEATVDGCFRLLRPLFRATELPMSGLSDQHFLTFTHCSVATHR